MAETLPIVAPKLTAPSDVVRLVSDTNVTAPVYVCDPVVVTLPAFMAVVPDTLTELKTLSVLSNSALPVMVSECPPPTTVELIVTFVAVSVVFTPKVTASP